MDINEVVAELKYLRDLAVNCHRNAIEQDSHPYVKGNLDGQAFAYDKALNLLAELEVSNE